MDPSQVLSLASTGEKVKRRLQSPLKVDLAAGGSYWRRIQQSVVSTTRWWRFSTEILKKKKKRTPRRAERRGALLPSFLVKENRFEHIEAFSFFVRDEVCQLQGRRENAFQMFLRLQVSSLRTILTVLLIWL